MRKASGKQAAVIVVGLMLAASRAFAAESDMDRVLAASGWKQPSRANCLFVGPGAVEAAIAAAKLQGVHSYLIVEKSETAKQARTSVDQSGLFGKSAFVREASLKEAPFPDYFFHRVVVLGGVNDGDRKELWRVTRPGGKLLLASGVTLKFEGGAGEKPLSGAAQPWREITRPVVGAEWPMLGGYFYKNTVQVSYASPDTVIKPPLKLLWTTRAPWAGQTGAHGGGGTIVAGGRVYFVPAYGGGFQPYAFDAYTGEILRGDVPQGLLGAHKDLLFVMKGQTQKAKGVLTALDSESLAEKWTTDPEMDFVGISDGKVVCRRGKDAKTVVYLDAATGRKVGESAPGEVDVQLGKWVANAITSEGDVYSKGGHSQAFSFRGKSGGASNWGMFVGTHDCGTPAIANGYLWAELGHAGFAAFRLGLSGELAKETGWYHAWSYYNCYGPVVAYGNMYTGDTRRRIACLAPGEPYPAQANPQGQPALERGESPVSAADRYDPADWPMHQHDPARTGRSLAAVRPPSKVLWSTSVGGEIVSSPAVAGDTVFVGSTDGKLYAFDADTGKVRWTFLTDGEIHCSCCVWSGMVYFGSDDGWIYCLNASTGKMIWRRQADHTTTEPVSLIRVVEPGFNYDFFHWIPEYGGGDQCVGPFSLEGTAKAGPWVVRGSPMVVDGRLYIGTGLTDPESFWGDLYCLDAKTGELVWKRKESRAGAFFYYANGVGISVFEGAPAYARGRVYVMGAYGLDAAEAATGEDAGLTEPYRHRYVVRSASSIALADDRAFANVGGEVYCFSLVDGSVLGVGRGGEAVIADGQAFCGGVVYPTSGWKSDEKLDGKGLRPLVSVKTLQSVKASSPAAMAGGLLFYVRSERGNTALDCVDVGEDKVISTVPIEAKADSPPAVARGKVFVGANDGKVYCLGN